MPDGRPLLALLPGDLHTPKGDGFHYGLSSMSGTSEVPSIPSWGSPLQSVLLFDLALALIAAPPPSPLGGFTFRPARASGYHSSNKGDDPSLDRHLSWGSLPFDVARRSVRRSAGRAYGFASRTGPPKRSSAIQAPWVRRNNTSRACCPAPAPIGLRVVDLVRSSVLVCQRASRLRRMD